MSRPRATAVGDAPSGARPASRLRGRSRFVAAKARGAWMAIAVSSLVSACAGGEHVRISNASADAWLSRPAWSLAAAADDPSVEVIPVLDWPRSPVADSAEPEGASPPLVTRVAVRMALPERAGWTVSPRASLVIERHWIAQHGLVMALDVGGEEGGSGRSLLLLRASLGLGGRSALDAAGQVRFTYRFGLAFESMNVRGIGETIARNALFGGLGVASGPAGGRWDVTFEYLMLYAENSLESEAQLGVSLRF